MNKIYHTTILAAMTEWLAYLEVTRYSHKTVLVYEQAVLNFNRFLESRAHPRTLLAVKLTDLDAWRLSLINAGCTTSTVDGYVRAVRRLFRWLFVTNRLFTDPSENFTSVKVNIPLGLCPTEAEMSRLLEEICATDRISLRDRALLEVAYSTGARLEELAKLDLNAVATDSVRLLGKGGRERTVPLTSAAINAVNAYLINGRSRFVEGQSDGGPALFLSQRTGCRISAPGIALMIKRRAKYSGIKVTPHAFRRAFATHLLRGGAALAEIKELLGHQRFRHLRHYMRMHPTEVLETARKSKPGRR